MRANELMIGDWVYNTYNMQNEQVRAIGFKFVTLAYNGLYEYDDITPILLTKEILEKNGFNYGYTSNEEDILNNTIATSSEDDKGWVWDEGAGSVKVIFPNESDGGVIIVDDQSFDKYLELVFCENIFVHELQHLLRLVGIDKTIEL